MGHNTTVVIMNDALSVIREDENFGFKIADAISRMGAYDYLYNSVSARSGGNVHVNAAVVVETHHSAGISVVAVGGNTATVLSPYVGSGTHHQDDDKKRIVSILADELGYKLVKK